MRRTYQTIKKKQELKEFLDNVKKLKDCKCNLLNPCRKCQQIVTGKQYLKLLTFDNN